jgi:leucyl aminopeptidase
LHNLENTLCDRVLLVGCGKEKDITTRNFRNINQTMVKRLQASGATEIATYLTDA